MNWFHWFSLITLALAGPVLIPWAREAMPPIDWHRHDHTPEPLTALRIVDLDGRPLATVRHWDPRAAWAMADDILARTPNPHRLLIEPVHT